VRFLSNAAGAGTDTYEYDAFGNQIYRSGTTPNNYMYRGEFFDSDLGLYYLRARYYNPVTGRFMSRDPEDGDPTDPASLHKYLYAGGDPVNRIDPRGREEFVENGLITKLVTLTVVTTAIVYGRNGLSMLACDAVSMLEGGALAVMGYEDITLNFANCSAEGKKDDDWNLKDWLDKQLNPPPPPPSRCQEVKAMCEATCWESVQLRKGDRQGKQRRCVRLCMEGQGCYGY
jgi:RHS repeat-associated protein